MAHIARRYAPGTVQHVVIRFASREFRLDAPGARAEYLRRLARALGRTDWKLVAFALMSSHIHLVLVAGHDPLSRLLLPVHSAFARWLNRVQSRSGPVFEGRARSIIATDERSGVLIAYVHNNPVRAGVVATALDSPWTSHAAYCEEGVSAPEWLCVQLGLERAGFDDSPDGRAAFDAMVQSRSGDPRDPVGSGETLRAARASIRRLLGAGVETVGAEGDVGTGNVELGVRVPPGMELRPRWTGDLERVVAAVARETAVELSEIRRRTQVRAVVAARRLAVRVITRELGRTVTDAAAVVGLTLSGASRLLNRSRDGEELSREIERAAVIADECWRGAA